MEVLSPACSGGVPCAEGSSVPVGKGGAPRFQDPARVGLAAPPWAHWLRAGSRVPSERRVWMDKPWRPISRAAVTNSPNTEARTLCLLVWVLGSVWDSWGALAPPTHLWPRPPHCRPYPVASPWTHLSIFSSVTLLSGDCRRDVFVGQLCGACVIVPLLSPGRDSGLCPRLTVAGAAPWGKGTGLVNTQPASATRTRASVV